MDWLDRLTRIGGRGRAEMSARAISECAGYAECAEMC